MKLQGTRAKVSAAFSIVLPPFAIGLDYWQNKLEQAIFEDWGHRVVVEFETAVIEPVEFGGKFLGGGANTITGVNIIIDNEDDAVEFALRYL